MARHRTVSLTSLMVGAPLWLALVMSACVGGIGGDDAAATGGTNGQGGMDCSTPPELLATKKIMDGLSPQCVGCHQAENGAFGFFASLDAFVNLVVANPELVVPGSPDESRLVHLLEGNGSGTVKQMPLAGEPYATLPGAALTMAQIKTWITELQPIVVSDLPYRDAVTSSRLPTPMFEYAVPALLGITLNHTDNKGNYAVLPPDTTTQPGSAGLYLSLGGGSSLKAATRNRKVHATFVQYVSQLSMRWCELAVEQSSSQLFTTATPNTGSAEAETVRSNIAQMQLLLLGAESTGAEIDALFDDVFVPLEAASTSERAWVGVCSALMRDPRFLLY